MVDWPLGELGAEAFLREYWQRRPLLIRQAFPDFRAPLSPDELAGLALEEEVESRIVLEHVDSGDWELRHGPFAETDFAALPDARWTLLVQDVDKHVAPLSGLLERFRFLPEWRIDDLMVSYAAPGGSVGPHVDRYDVFLLQAHGRRRWQIVDPPPAEERLRPRTDLRLLAEFTPTEEWVLEPGDMLYLPPGVPHHGVAVDNCMTYSIGFRAPAWREILVEVFERVLDGLETDDLYRDPPLTVAHNPAAIPNAVLARVRSVIKARLQIDDSLVDAAFAATVTRPKAQFVDRPPEGTLHRGAALVAAPATRLALLAKGSGEPTVFVDGDPLEGRAEDRHWLEELTRTRRLSAATVDGLDPAARRCVQSLLDNGQLRVEDTDA